VKIVLQSGPAFVTGSPPYPYCPLTVMNTGLTTSLKVNLLKERESRIASEEGRMIDQWSRKAQLIKRRSYT